MGIENLGKTNIPSTKINWFEIVGVCKLPAPLDVAKLMFNLLWCHAPNACHGNYDQAWRQLNKFCRFFQSNLTCRKAADHLDAPLTCSDTLLHNLIV
jgi:hypothetical protein